MRDARLAARESGGGGLSACEAGVPLGLSNECQRGGSSSSNGSSGDSPLGGESGRGMLVGDSSVGAEACCRALALAAVWLGVLEVPCAFGALSPVRGAGGVVPAPEPRWFRACAREARVDEVAACGGSLSSSGGLPLRSSGALWGELFLEFLFFFVVFAIKLLAKCGSNSYERIRRADRKNM